MQVNIESDARKAASSALCTIIEFQADDWLNDGQVSEEFPENQHEALFDSLGMRIPIQFVNDDSTDDLANCPAHVALLHAQVSASPTGEMAVEADIAETDDDFVLASGAGVSGRTSTVTGGTYDDMDLTEGVFAPYQQGNLTFARQIISSMWPGLRSATILLLLASLLYPIMCSFVNDCPYIPVLRVAAALCDCAGPVGECAELVALISI
jgi:hypothetical protein